MVPSLGAQRMEVQKYFRLDSACDWRWIWKGATSMHRTGKKRMQSCYLGFRRKRHLTQIPFFFKGTPGYKQKLILIDSQRFVKTKLGDKLLPLASFGPASLLPLFQYPRGSGMALSPVFLSCGPKLRPLCCCDIHLCGDGVGR